MHKFTEQFWKWIKEKKPDKSTRQEKFAQWTDLCENFSSKPSEEITRAFNQIDLTVTEPSPENSVGGTGKPIVIETGPEGSKYRVLYEGETADGRQHGTGRCEFPDGRVYVGQWEWGKMNGSGQMRWTNGQVYDGLFVDDKRSGMGQISWPDGRSYNGQWMEGKQHGRGTYADGKGHSWTGVWAFGKKAQVSEGFRGQSPKQSSPKSGNREALDTEQDTRSVGSSSGGS